MRDTDRQRNWAELQDTIIEGMWKQNEQKEVAEKYTHKEVIEIFKVTQKTTRKLDPEQRWPDGFHRDEIQDFLNCSEKKTITRARIDEFWESIGGTKLPCRRLVPGDVLSVADMAKSLKITGHQMTMIFINGEDLRGAKIHGRRVTREEFERYRSARQRTAG